MLLARAALPVHAVCAAIQSIGIVRRDVEQDASHGLGRSILPAIIIHGLFDFCILALAFFLCIESPVNSGQQLQDLEMKKVLQQLYGFTVGAVITFFALVYYFIQAYKQRHRLNALEMTTAVPMTTIGHDIINNR